MSARNNQTNKAAARERLRAERERQAKKDKTRRQLFVGGSIIVVLAIAAGVGYGVMQLNKPSGWEAAKSAKVVAPKNTTGTDGTTVVVGKASAKKTLQMYEDPRCPICATFDQTVGATVQKDLDAGKFKIQYIGATFIDNNGGEGSKNGLSALGAALNVSPTAFEHYKTAMYSAKWHPDETTDTFKDDSYLIKIAQTVPELKDNKAFQKAVTDGTYDAWAMKMSAKFDKSGVTGTPTLKMDGKKLTTPGSDNAPMSVANFNTALDKALKA
ncbi:thioredoxin domain-containing protein [Streptomyces sp. NPDC090052]|uniref:thioredoxin domain-containing protein n=1 Tax=unclassified Streptomyces TaxID=2593676 RepID=UPI00225AFB32|nr:thioredoxin domain-containing protein [Streptomyces sp. NBC_01306]MCX4727148.1 DsbA family protein [Streptomyces sp. NBC_01306]WSX41642.1 DsbA family protein [Streptomyces sp. NBC_00963]WSX70399.1 DsbA family protein [Streptomyces sp. NBC_00932]